MKTMRPLSLAVLLAVLAGAAQATDAPVRYEASHEAMGTTYSVVAYGRDQTFLSEAWSRGF